MNDIELDRDGRHFVPVTPARRAGTASRLMREGGPTVYLAGPIAGCSYAGATDWRDRAQDVLARDGIRGLSPMRAKEYLKGVGAKLEHPYPVGTAVRARGISSGRIGKIVEHGPKNVSYRVEWEPGYTGHYNHSLIEAVAEDVGFSATCQEYGHLSPLSGPRGIMTRDRFDATRCDVLLVNLLGAAKVSIGTVMEIAWADLKRTPIVVAIENDGSNPHEHAMIGEAIGFRCGTLDEALDVVRSILS